MITYKQEDDKVTLEMDRADFRELLLMLGLAVGRAANSEDWPMFWHWIDFANRVNASNPNFIPYEVPPPKQTH